jgi:hypothetical protein
MGTSYERAGANKREWAITNELEQTRENGQLRTSWSKQERMGNYERAGANKREWAITNELEQTRQNGKIGTK